MRRIKDWFGPVFFPGSGRHAVDRATEFVDPYAAARQVHESQSVVAVEDRKSTRLNSSHVAISYAVFCLKKKITTRKNAGFITPETAPSTTLSVIGAGRHASIVIHMARGFEATSSFCPGCGFNLSHATLV